MRRFTVVLVCFLILSAAAVQAQWQVYDASVLPAETGTNGTLDLTAVSDNSPGAGMIQEILDDPDISGNKILEYLHPDGKTMFRHNFDGSYTDSSFTLMARLKGENDPAYDRAFDLQWRNGNANSREELRIWPADSTIELEKANVTVKLDADLYAWHTYRIVVDGDMATIYMDEDPIPVVSGASSESSGDHYIKIGDGSGDAIGGYLDWCILDMTGAYGPGEGAEIPVGLYVDGVVNPVMPKWLVYDASVLPSETSSDNEGLDLTGRSDDSPGTLFFEGIIDDPEISGNKLLKYLQPDGKLMYRHNFDASYTDTAFTLMARIKGENNPAYDRSFDLHWRNGNAGTRDELRIWPTDSTLELEKANVSIKLDINLYAWHTFRVVVTGSLATVFLDENETPVLSGVTTSSTTDNYLKIGDGSGEAIGGSLDWCILDLSGGYAPGEGSPVPSELKVDSGPEPVIPKWLVYDASVLPSQTSANGDTLDLTGVSDNSPGAGFIEEVVDDPDINGNKLLKYLHPDGKLMYRHKFDDSYTDSSFTMMARVKGEDDPAYDRAFDLQWRNGNADSREELRIWPADSTLELEKANITVKVDADLYAWHTYRIAVNGDESTIYLDEQETPVLSGVSSESSSDHYIKIGDGSGDAIGGYLDWCILDMSGAFGPGEGLAIPEGLHVDKYLEPAPEGWQIYDASLLPSLTGSGGDSLDLSSVSQGSPGPGFVEEIIDDPDITGNKILKYLNPDGTTMYRYIFPEGWTGEDLTMIARVKGENDEAYDRVFDLEWRNANAGSRDVLRLYGHDSRIKLEKAGVDTFPDMDLFAWHTYRIAVSGDTARVYVDENSEPIITGVSTSSSTENYIKIGDGSGENIGGYLDWCILDLTGAYAPGEGTPIPSQLHVDEYSVAVEKTESGLPQQFRLYQNYPNPFNPTTAIHFDLPAANHVEISVFNALGKKVATLADADYESGRYMVQFDAAAYASGVYFYRIQAGENTQVRKMLLMK